jgi:hypothetical protein
LSVLMGWAAAVVDSFSSSTLAVWISRHVHTEQLGSRWLLTVLLTGCCCIGWACTVVLLGQCQTGSAV